MLVYGARQTAECGDKWEQFWYHRCCSTFNGCNLPRRGCLSTQSVRKQRKLWSRTNNFLKKLKNESGVTKWQNDENGALRWLSFCRLLVSLLFTDIAATAFWGQFLGTQSLVWDNFCSYVCINQSRGNDEGLARLPFLPTLSSWCGFPMFCSERRFARYSCMHNAVDVHDQTTRGVLVWF